VAHHIPFVSWFPFSTNTDGLSIAVSPSYPADPTLWGGTIGTGIFRTQNNGATWELERTGYFASRSDRVLASPTYGEDHSVFVTALGSGLFGSSDGGQSWRPLNASLDYHMGFGLVSAIAVSPAYVTDRTLYVSRRTPTSSCARATAAAPGRWPRPACPRPPWATSRSLRPFPPTARSLPSSPAGGSTARSTAETTGRR